MFWTLEAIFFHGKELLRTFAFHQKYRKRSHNKTDVRHIWKIDNRTIRWDLWRMNTINLGGDSSWKHIYLWLVAEKSSISRAQRFTYFQILCYALERWTTTHNLMLSGKTNWRGSRNHHNTELRTQLMVSQWNSSRKSSQDSNSATMSKSCCQNWAKSQKNLQDGSSSCRCSTTSHGDQKKIRKNGNQALNWFRLMPKDFSPRRWSFLGSEWNGISHFNVNHKENGTEFAELMMFKFGESGHPVFRATNPLSRGTLENKRGG